MYATFRLALAVPLLAVTAWLSACAGDKASPLSDGLLAHVSLEGWGLPKAWVSGARPASTHLQASDADTPATCSVRPWRFRATATPWLWVPS